MGIQTPLYFLDNFAPKKWVHYEHFQLFKGVSNGPFLLQESEVEEIMFLDIHRWENFIYHPDELITPNARYIVKLAIERGWWGT